MSGAKKATILALAEAVVHITNALTNLIDASRLMTTKVKEIDARVRELEARS